MNYCLFCKIVASLRESIIYSGWVAYDRLVDFGAKAHYRVKHSKNEFALGKNHINGIRFATCLIPFESLSWLLGFLRHLGYA